jgi:DNA-binding transcriptional MerR regulator
MFSKREQLKPTFEVPPRRESVTMSEADEALYGKLRSLDEANDKASGLVLREDGSPALAGFEVRVIGLIIDDGVSAADYERFGALLKRLKDDTLAWIVGDYMAYGERKWGKTYAEVGELTGYSYQTLRDYAYAANNVELSIRIDNLPFAHHRLVAPYDAQWQVFLLNYAREHGLSLSQFKAAIPALVNGDEVRLPGKPTKLMKFEDTTRALMKKAQRMAQARRAEDRAEVARIAREQAQFWQELAQQMEQPDERDELLYE